jgi:hypothetical protein
MYEAYCASSDGKNFRGEPCPQWMDLPPAIHRHWGAAAELAKNLVSTSRRVERLRTDGVWVEINFDEVNTLDTIRMFEPDGSLVDGQASVRVEERHAQCIRVGDDAPKQHDQELREQMKYIEYQLQTLDMTGMTELQRADATRKMRHRHELLRLALDTQSQK